MIESKKQKELILYLVFSILFALTIQQFPFFKGNSLHLLHAIKDFDFNKLQNDWIANQTNHLPFFTYFNNIILQVFPIKILHIVHFCLLVSCSFFLFLICKNEFPNLNKLPLSLIWFSVFILIYHEHSFFGGIAGQDIINEGYQPASFGVLFYIGIFLYLVKKDFYAVLFICLSASFHPSYVLHSGFLLLGISIYYAFTKEYKRLFRILILYAILISPITIYTIYNFLLIDKQLILEGQNILLDRIPHHALINNWFSYKDVLSILIYIISLFLIYKNKRIFIPLIVLGFLSIFFTLIQFFTENNSLALTFPWRASVFLIPISTMIITSFLIQKFFSNKINLRTFSIILFTIIFSFFFIKNHFIKNSNKDFYKKLELIKKINKNYDSIERILIPVELTYIRMNTGLPIFIDWKHHAFKYSEIIIWKNRINLAEKFFTSNEFEERKLILENINKIEKVSHILIYQKDLYNNCDNLIDDKKFAFIDAKKCYELN